MMDYIYDEETSMCLFNLAFVYWKLVIDLGPVTFVLLRFGLHHLSNNQTENFMDLLYLRDEPNQKDILVFLSSRSSFNQNTYWLNISFPLVLLAIGGGI